MTQSELAIASD